MLEVVCCVATLVGVWLMLIHYDKKIVRDYVQRLHKRFDSLADRNYATESWLGEVKERIRLAEHRLVLIESHQLKMLDDYHESKLLPALTLLASQRISCEPPAEVVEESVAKPKIRPQLEADQVENIWTRVAGTC